MQKKSVKKPVKQSRVIRISQENYDRLSQFATHFREPIDTVIKRILDKAASK